MQQFAELGEILYMDIFGIPRESRYEGFYFILPSYYAFDNVMKSINSAECIVLNHSNNLKKLYSFNVMKNRVDHHWSTCYEPRLRDTALLRHNQDIRCFTGDALNYVCGLYNGNIEVWAANLSPSTSLECNSKHPSRRLNRSDSSSG